MTIERCSCPESLALRAEVERLREALETAWAGIGDMLLGNRPLDKPYARSVARDVAAALRAKAGEP